MSRRSAATREEARASPVNWGRASPIHCSRASPVQWSDNSSEEEEDTEQQPSPSTNCVAEHCSDADIHQRYSAESPLLKRRPLHHCNDSPKEESTNQTYGVTEHRNLIDSLQPKSEIIKLKSDVLCRKSKVQRERQEVLSGHVLLPIIITAGLIFMCVIYFVCFNRSSNLNSGLVPLNSKNLIRRVQDALIKFKNIPSDVVVKFSAGIKSILESDPNKPAVFVVLYNDTGHGSYCLAKKIASLAMEYLGSSERDPLILNPKDLKKDENMIKDYGLILEKYKPLVEKHRSTVISHLQDLPGKMAMAFHFFCDTYDPVVQKALFIFTLQMINDNSARKIEQVESRMHELWRNEISDDQRQALITRLTEEIIALPSDIWPSEKCPQ